MRTFRRSQSALTLLEVVVCVSIIAIVSVWTMDVIANGRSLQGRARDKADLTVIAQMELDQLRLQNMEWTSGTMELAVRPEWPMGTTVEAILSPHEKGFHLLEVRAMRTTADGPVTSKLQTLVGGGSHE